MSLSSRKFKPNASVSPNDDKLFTNRPTVQSKLKMGKQNDPFEKEADAKADSIVSPQLNHFGEPTFFQPVSKAQMAINRNLLKANEPISNSEKDTSSFETSLQSSKGGGQKMDNGTKSEMESGFGTDLSNVKIHTGPNAVQMNEDIGAKAFTNGSDVYFNKGNYNPSSKEGKHLLAHELTHTVQQGAVGTHGGNSVQKKADTIQKMDILDGITATGGFDKDSASHVSAMDTHITSRIKELEGKILTSKGEIDVLAAMTSRTTEQEDTLTKTKEFKGIMESYLAEMKMAKSEFATMKTSSQLFKIRTSGVAGETTYSDIDKSVTMGYKDHLYRLGHELKHGYDYLEGKITFNKKKGGIGVAGDLGDETRGFKREMAMGAPWAKDRTLDIITKEKVKNQTDEGGDKPYEKFPSEDIDVNTPNIKFDKDAVFK